jgi:hypothetical protein
MGLIFAYGIRAVSHIELNPLAYLDDFYISVWSVTVASPASVYHQTVEADSLLGRKQMK